MNELLRHHLSPTQVEASKEFMGLDTQLIDDGTYFVCEDEEEIIGCGGWSKRKTLFGGNHTIDRDPSLLNPNTDGARIRAMYTDPQHTRRGVGRMILDACEKAIQNAGFTRAALVATLSGEPLYKKAGYRPKRRFCETSSRGIDVPLIEMEKSLK